MLRTTGVAGLVVGMLAFGATARAQVGGWSEVVHVRTGRDVIVVSQTLGQFKGQMAFADDAHLTVLRFFMGGASPSVMDAIERLGLRLSAIDRGPVTMDSVTVARNGVFDGGEKVADVVTLPRDDVATVSLPQAARGGSIPGMIAGAVGGAVAGALIAPYFMFKRCGGSCADEWFGFGASLVGMPVAGGLAGYYAGRSSGEPRAIYRAPRKQVVPLDEASWRAIERALPPSLRGTPKTERQ